MLDLHTIASASFLSREDRRAYLAAMEAEAKRQTAGTNRQRGALAGHANRRARIKHES